MKNEKWLWFDMDGSINDFYGVEGWLEDLKNWDVRPYEIAPPKYDEIEMLETLEIVKAKGYKIGVISWLSKVPNEEYDNRVIKTKIEWLNRYGFGSFLDEILITPYGVKKSDICKKYGYGILVDDEQQNRDAWDLGFTINANENIISKLSEL